MSEPQSTAPRKPWPKQAIILLILLAFLASLPALWQLQSVRLALAQSLLLYGPASCQETVLQRIQLEGPVAARVFLNIYAELATHPNRIKTRKLPPTNLAFQLSEAIEASPQSFVEILPLIESLPAGLPRATLSRCCLSGLSDGFARLKLQPLPPELCARLAAAIYDAPEHDNDENFSEFYLLSFYSAYLLNLERIGLRPDDMERILTRRLTTGPKSYRSSILSELNAFRIGPFRREFSKLEFTPGLVQSILSVLESSKFAGDAIDAAVLLTDIVNDEQRLELSKKSLLRGQDFLHGLRIGLNRDENDKSAWLGSSFSTAPCPNSAITKSTAHRLLLNFDSIPRSEVLNTLVSYATINCLETMDQNSIPSILDKIHSEKCANSPWRRALAWIAISSLRPDFSGIESELNEALRSTNPFESLAALRALTWSTGQNIRREQLLNEALQSADPDPRSLVMSSLHLQEPALQERLFKQALLHSPIPINDWPLIDRESIQVFAWKAKGPITLEIEVWVSHRLEEQNTLDSLELLAPLCWRSRSASLLQQLDVALHRLSTNQIPLPGTIAAVLSLGPNPERLQWLEQWTETRFDEILLEANFDPTSDFYLPERALSLVIASQPEFPNRELWIQDLGHSRNQNPSSSTSPHNEK